jgi:hypothetical protein
VNWTPAYALVFTHILGWTQGAEVRKLALSLGERAKAQFPSFRSCEKINNLTQRRQGAKTRKGQLLCFLCAFYDFAPLREMLLLIQGLFHSFFSLGKR